MSVDFESERDELFWFNLLSIEGANVAVPEVQLDTRIVKGMPTGSAGDVGAEFFTTNRACWNF